MLYDTRWDQNTKAKVSPLSLSSLIAWLETMPPEQEYTYMNTSGCLLCQFAKMNGFSNVLAGYDYIIILETNEHKLIPFGGKISCPAPHTFGAALTRARAIINTERTLS